MKRYTHILFDHDGVLVDTEPLYFRATQTCVADLGVDLRLPQYLAMMAEGRNAWELARQLGASEFDIEQARERRNSLYRELLDSEPIDIAGVEDVLANLALNYRIAIVTTSRTEDFELIHRNRDIVSLVDFVLTRDAYEHSKPHPDPYFKALERFGIEPDFALAVEDSQRGLRSAIAAGLDCAVVYNRFTSVHDFSQATYQITRLADLIPHVLNRS